MSSLSFVLNILLGQACVGCKKSGALLCEDCGVRLPHAETVPFAHACLDYHDERVRKLIGVLKFRGAWSIAPLLGKLLYERLFEDLGDANLFTGNLESDRLLVVAIPLSRTRLIKRGFNQSELLAKALIERCEEKKMEFRGGVLKKVRETKRQVELNSREDRLTNLTRAFRADANLVNKRHVLLIDDVTTTGATFAEGKRALFAAGAASVTCLALAH